MSECHRVSTLRRKTVPVAEDETKAELQRSCFHSYNGNMQRHECAELWLSLASCLVKFSSTRGHNSST